jgi:class 3 adenylate cyclase
MAGRLREQVRRPRWLALHAAVDAVIFGYVVALWLFERTTPAAREAARSGGFWPLIIALGLGIPLGLHALLVFVTAPPREPARGRRAAPVGRALATVLFTDIVKSTERVGQVGDRRWAQFLEVHDRLARELVERFGGRLVKSTGDGILATFEGPGRAIGCALALRERLRRTGLEIRAGLHTGEVEFRGADVGGIAVHTAARVMAAAGPGEVLVSRTVRDLVAGSHFALQDRGSHSLKGIAGEWQLFAVQHPRSSSASGR